MEIFNKIETLLLKNNFKITEKEVKSFGIVYRGLGLDKLDKTRIDLFESGHKTPISCHREEGSVEAVMIIWNE